MARYLLSHQCDVTPRALVILHDNEAYLPVFAHGAVDQDRAVGAPETFREHTHDVYHLVLYTESSGSYLKCGTRFEAEPGTLVIVSPGQSHNFVSLRQSSVYSEITFTFATEKGKLLTLPFAKVLDIYTGVPGCLREDSRLPKETTQELVSIMIQILDYLQSPSPLSEFYAHRALAHAFEMIVAHCYAERTPTADIEHNSAVLRVKEYIQEHYTRPITADELASLSNYSRGHLFHAFKKAFHVAPLAYQQDLRFEAAQRLLRFTSLHCYEISQRVGYTNVHYFHRQFKKRLGVTPNHYRQSKRRPPA